MYNPVVIRLLQMPDRLFVILFFTDQLVGNVQMKRNQILPVAGESPHIRVDFLRRRILVEKSGNSLLAVRRHFQDLIIYFAVVDPVGKITVNIFAVLHELGTAGITESGKDTERFRLAFIGEIESEFLHTALGNGLALTFIINFCERKKQRRQRLVLPLRAQSAHSGIIVHGIRLDQRVCFRLCRSTLFFLCRPGNSRGKCKENRYGKACGS